VSESGDQSERLGTFALVVVGLAVVAGVVLRFVATSPLWLDEAQTVEVARLPIADIPAALGRDGLPPLFYVLLHPWMQVFGEGDAAVRALAGVFGVLALPLAYLAGRRLGGPRVGAFALVLLALNPFAIRYATEARMYSLVMLLVLAGYLLVDQALDRAPERPSLATSAGIAVVTALLLYSHYWSMWLLAAVGTVLVLVAWRRRQPNAGRVLVAMAVGGVLFLPWVPTFLEQAAHTGTPWATASRPTQILAISLVDFGGGPLPEGLLLGTPVLALLFFLGLFGRTSDGFRLELDLRTVPPGQGIAAVAGLTLAYGAVVSVLGSSAFASRYAAVVLPLFLLVAALGVARIGDPRVQGVVLAAVCVLGLGASIHAAVEPRTQAGDIADVIRAGDPDGAPLGPSPVVVYCPDQLGSAVHRILDDGPYDEVIFPNLESDEVISPGRVDWYDYADRQESVPVDEVARQVLDRAGDENAVWVVWSPEYRTPGERCDRLVEAIGRERAGRILVSADPSVFEHASLALYPPPAP
jgi:hypothetical protein